MSNKNLEEMIKNIDSTVGQSKNALAKLWRTVLKDNNVTHDSFNHAINRYLNKAVALQGKSKKDVSREKGNLVKELSNDALTWKNFIKGVRVLNPVSLDIRVTIKWKRGRETVHEVSVDIAQPDTNDD